MKKEKNIAVETFAKKIKRLREDKKWSQIELAEKIKTDNRQISLYEHGKGYPAVETLIRLSKIFGVTVDYLVMDKLTDEAVAELKDNELLEFFKNAENFREEDKKAIKIVLNAFVVKTKIDDIKK